MDESVEELDPSFQIVSPDKCYETICESVCARWCVKFPMIPPGEPRRILGQEKNWPISKYIASSKYSMGFEIQNPCEWCIQLNPNYWENGKRYISLFVWLYKFCRQDKPPEEKSVHAIYEFDAWTSHTDQQMHSKLSSVHKFSEERSCFGFKKFMPFPKVKATRTGPLNLEGALMQMTILVSVRMIKDIDGFVFPCTIEDNECLLKHLDPDANVPFPVEEVKRRRKIFFVNQNIQAVVKDLRKSHKNYDVLVRSAKKDHKSHLSILKARIPTRTIKFDTKVLDKKNQKVVDMTEFSDATVAAVLDFCYKGYTKYFTSYKKILHVFTAAKKFNMESLEKQCLIEFMNCLTPEYYFHVLQVALLSAKDEELKKTLKEVLRKYFIKNRILIRNANKSPEIVAHGKKMLIRLFLTDY